MVELEVIVHCFHLYCKKPCLINVVSSCAKAFSHFYITVVHSEKILFCISQFVSSFFKSFWSILHTSSFHCLFSHISLFFLCCWYSSWYFPHAVILCVCCVFNLWSSQLAANDLLCASMSSFCYVGMLKSCLKMGSYFVRFVQSSFKGCGDWPDFPQ